MRGEKREIKMDGASPVKNSGRGVLKGDASIGPALIDYKHYTSSFSINKKSWEKHSRDAFNDGYEMAAYSVILEGDGTSVVKVAVIDWEWFRHFIERYIDDTFEG